MDYFGWGFWNPTWGAYTSYPTDALGGGGGGGWGDGTLQVFFPDQLDPEHDEAISEAMGHKIDRHRISSITTGLHSSDLGTHFHPWEHEYVSDKVVRSVFQGKISQAYLGDIRGEFPKRTFVGPVTMEFITKVFFR